MVPYHGHSNLLANAGSDGLALETMTRGLYWFGANRRTLVQWFALSELKRSYRGEYKQAREGIELPSLCESVCGRMCA